MTLDIDFETQSDVDLKQAGVYVYMESPHTKPLMASYTLDGWETVRRWRPPEPCPSDILRHIEAGGMMTAHNAQFERLLWRMILTPRYGWPALKTENCRCTAATACALALPRDLDRLGSVLDLSVQKDKVGKRLIQKFSKPRKARKGEAPGLYFNLQQEHPADFEQFHDYCDDDVRTEAEADSRMVPLSDAEQELWVIDQRINDRGIRIDTKSAKAALQVAERAKKQLDKEIKEITGGAVPSARAVAKLVEWVNGQGVELPSAEAAEIVEALELVDLPANVRRVLEIRQEAGKTSVSKLTAFLKRVGSDGRIRGAFLYHAASTGRWSSVGAQLHNLPRPRKEFGAAKLNAATLFDAIRQGDPAWLKALYGDELGKPLHLISDAIRGFIWAAPEHDLLVADYSGIEGAVAAWFANETWKVKALFEIKADPSLPDMYRRAAAGIFDTTPDEITKKDDRRQVGKVSELSLQYQGGPNAFRSMARNYGLSLDEIYPIVWGAASDERKEKAQKRYKNAVARGEPVTKLLSEEAFLAAEIVKLGWRASNPEIAGMWPQLEDAMRQAIRYPGTQVAVGRSVYLVRNGFLWCKLPSDRCLAYANPRLKDQVWARLKVDGEWSEVSETMGRAEAQKLELKGEAKIEGEAQAAVTACGVDSVTKKWRRFALYGGLAFENIVQAIARDLLASGIRISEREGYPVIGHVHDEIITEVPRGWGDLAAFEKAICQLPDWAEGLPLAADGWRGKRYRKD